MALLTQNEQVHVDEVLLPPSRRTKRWPRLPMTMDSLDDLGSGGGQAVQTSRQRPVLVCRLAVTKEFARFTFKGRESECYV
jgi:hypothetical protein